MTATLKAELKKLFTIRSTYYVSIFALLLAAFIMFYAVGFKQTPRDTSLFVESTLTGFGSMALFAAIVSLLLLGNEYRYNTIIYTLSSARSRSKVLLSKIVIVMTYALVYTTVLMVVALGMLWAGVAASGHPIPHQDINYLVYYGKVLFYAEAYVIAALLFVALLRNVIGAIAVLLLLPGTIETLLSLLLKHNSVYMPFTALSQVIQAPTFSDKSNRLTDAGHLSPIKGAIVFLIYLIIGWIIAWYLFLKRDAS